METCRKRSLTIAVITLFSGLAYSTSVLAGGYFVPEMDAKAMAQSVAWTARARGASSVFFNPAGLARLEGWEIKFGTTLVAWNSTAVGPLPLTLRSELVNNITPPSHGFAAVRLNDKFAVGIGLTTPWGLKLDWGPNWPSGYDYGAFMIETVYLKTYLISPTIAYAINDKLSIGGGVQLAMATAELTNLIDLGSLAQAAGLPGALPARLALKADNGIGDFGVQAGIQYESGKLSAGLAYQSAIKLGLEGIADFTIPTSGIGQVDGLLKSLFPDQAGKTEIPLPHVVSVGVAYRPLKHLEVEVDVNYTTWSDFETLVIDFSEETVFSTPAGDIPVLTDAKIDEKWDNGFTYRFGAAYDLTDKMQLRAGALYDPTVIPDETLSPFLPESDRIGFTAGIGFEFGDMELDLAYMYLDLKERTTMVQDRGFNATYDSVAHLFGATLTVGGGK